MFKLNLPNYQFTTRKSGDKIQIFDTQRKRYVTLTPEEWVRQNFITYLIQEKKYPSGLIAVETQIEINGLKKRCDAIVYDKNMQAFLIIEFKSPMVEITQSTFDQVAVYNYKLQVEQFILSNGIQHFYCRVNNEKQSYDIQTEIPDYESLLA